jgi:hypothetical protein
MALPLVHLHRPDMLSATFERGVFRSLKTGARIEYEPFNLDQNNGFGGNYRGPLLLWRSIQLLMAAPYNLLPFTSLTRNDEAEYPIHGSIFANDEAPFSNLVLTNMVPKMAASNNIVDVELTYEHVLDGFNQILVNPPSGRLFVKGRSSIVDKTTNFFRKEGNPAFPKTQLEVAHTWLDYDIDITGMPFDPDLPRTSVQTGEINVPFPAKGFTLQGMIFTDDIMWYAKHLVAHVNSERLLGEDPLYWVCSEFSWEMHNAFNASWQNNWPAYKVSLEFQYNHDTWDADVVFFDKRTGMPPANLSVATIPDDNGVLRLTGNPLSPINVIEQPAGIWRVPFLPRQNFTQFFGGVLWEAVG